MGTHTNDDEPNYLQIASVRLPNEIKSEDTVMEEANGGKKIFTQRISNSNVPYSMYFNFA